VGGLFGVGELFLRLKRVGTVTLGEKPSVDGSFFFPDFFNLGKEMRTLVKVKKKQKKKLKNLMCGYLFGQS